MNSNEKNINIINSSPSENAAANKTENAANIEAQNAAKNNASSQAMETAETAGATAATQSGNNSITPAQSGENGAKNNAEKALNSSAETNAKSGAKTVKKDKKVNNVESAKNNGETAKSGSIPAKNDSIPAKNEGDNCKNGENKKAKMRVRDYIYWALSVFLIGILVMCVVLFVVGFRPAVVISPSMKPAIQPGSLVLVKSIDAEDIKVGDVIMFWPSDDAESNTDTLSTTHRVIEIKTDEAGSLVFITHGDANSEGSNETVPADRVIGKIYVSIPWIGVLFLFIKNNLLIVIFGAIAIMCLWYLISMYIKGNKEKKLALEKQAGDQNADSASSGQTPVAQAKAAPAEQAKVTPAAQSKEMSIAQSQGTPVAPNKGVPVVPKGGTPAIGASTSKEPDATQAVPKQLSGEQPAPKQNEDKQANDKQPNLKREASQQTGDKQANKNNPDAKKTNN